MMFVACKSLGFESRGVKVGTQSGTEPSMMWFAMSEKKSRDELDNLYNQGDG
jgi:hypothetical protein